MECKNPIKLVILSTIILILAGCGATPQPPVQLATNQFKDANLRIGFVYIPTNEKPTTHIYGASCLLCYGVASSLTSKLDTHIESTISAKDLLGLRDTVVAEYNNLDISLIESTLPTPVDKLKKFKGELGFMEKDFRPYKEALGVDALVVLEIKEHGAFRSFSGYIPNGAPQGYVIGALHMINLSTNAIMHYLPIDIKVPPQSEWDEPPTFPSVTTAYYQAVEDANKKIRDAL